MQELGGEMIKKTVTEKYITSDGKIFTYMGKAEEHEKFLETCPFKVGDKVCFIEVDCRAYPEEDEYSFHKGEITEVSRRFSIDWVEISGYSSSVRMSKIFPYSKLKELELYHRYILKKPDFPDYNVIIVNKDIRDRYNLVDYDDIFTIDKIVLTKNGNKLYVKIKEDIIELLDGDFLFVDSKATR